MKVQVFGSTGMLGQAVVQAALAAGHTVLTGVGRIEHVFIDRIEGDVIINCAGLVKQRQVPVSTLMLANVVGPHKLAEACSTMGSRLIQISTDCVFEGEGPHDEESIPDAGGAYALSKLAGEVTYAPHLTVRTSFVGFGPRGLVHDLQVESVVRASHKLLWTGHTVDTVATVLMSLVERPAIVGMLHIPGTEQTRYTLARDLKSRWSFPAKVERNDEFVADRRLTSFKWAHLGLPTLPTFEMQLTTMRGPDA